MLKNLVFVSGPHGAGKSTLIRTLEESSPSIKTDYNIKSRKNQFYWNNYPGEINYAHRQALKVAERAIQSYHYERLARENPDKLIMGDRCIYDEKAYRKTLVGMGLIDPTKSRAAEEASYVLFSEETQKPRAIILNPPVDEIIRHLEKRWKEEGLWKFREEDRDYLKKAREEFSQMKDFEKVLYLEKPDIDKIKKWINGFYELKI